LFWLPPKRDARTKVLRWESSCNQLFHSAVGFPKTLEKHFLNKKIDKCWRLMEKMSRFIGSSGKTGRKNAALFTCKSIATSWAYHVLMATIVLSAVDATGNLAAEIESVSGADRASRN
jgi:hypothetical protein